MEGDLSQDEWPLPVGDPPYVEFEMYQDNCAEYLTQYDESGKTRERYNIIYDYHVVYYYIKQNYAMSDKEMMGMLQAEYAVIVTPK